MIWYVTDFGMVLISIHAPLTGSDTVSVTDTAGNVDFNPRSPHRERHYCTSMIISTQQISIHAPLTGSDMRNVKPNARAL